LKMDENASDWFVQKLSPPSPDQSTITTK
jgi:hypothetical protein